MKIDLETWITITNFTIRLISLKDWINTLVNGMALGRAHSNKIIRILFCIEWDQFCETGFA
jgi:hypothetical protein